MSFQLRKSVALPVDRPYLQRFLKTTRHIVREALEVGPATVGAIVKRLSLDDRTISWHETRIVTHLEVQVGLEALGDEVECVDEPDDNTWRLRKKS